MKKTWLLLLICFMLLLSGCRTQKPHSDEVAEVITEDNSPATENKDEVLQQHEEKPEKQESDDQSENDIYLEKTVGYVADIGDGYVILRTFHYDTPLFFKLYTENKYTMIGDNVSFTGNITPLETSEQCKNGETVYYVAKKGASAKFVFDPSELDLDGYIEHVTDDAIYVSLWSRGVKVYVDNASDYCERDYVNVKGVATAIEPYSVEDSFGYSLEILFEAKDAKITYAEEIGEKKPVIYLYPEKETEVSVKLTLDGKLTCVYPEYDDKWTVTAKPDGTLFDKNGREYYCLYWEGDTYAKLVPDKNVGFVVKGSDTAEFLREKLLYLGLNEREANEFIIYWLPQMEDNPYNYIYFSGEEYEQSAKLDITPSPDTLIRVMMAWQPLDSPREVTEQKLKKAPERNGFTAVEWGGAKIS